MTTNSSIDSRVFPVRLVVAAAMDAVLVIVFVAIGRASHDEAIRPGVLRTAGPFLAALGVGWLIVRALGLGAGSNRAGLVLWGVTVAGGMLIRTLSGQGTAPAFIVVATLVLGNH